VPLSRTVVVNLQRRFAYEVPFSSGILELPFLKSAAGCLNLTLQRQQD
jgi:hypothetical protein